MVSPEPLSPEPLCPPLHRPARLFAPDAPAHGLRTAGARVSGGSRIVEVYLYTAPPSTLAEPRRWTLRPAPGGAPVTVSAAVVVPTPEPHIELTVTGSPDPGRYRLSVLPQVAADPPLPELPLIPFDPLRTSLPVRLRPECPDLGSCFPDRGTPPARRPSPVHDYLARDWRSLRAALLEFLQRNDSTVDLSPADPLITVLELFAHLGDLLHYRLDRVSTEAYLSTARLRTSVKRHARLVDYALAEAASASTWVLLQADPDEWPRTAEPGDTAVTAAGEKLGFTLDLTEPLPVHPALGEIAIYDWGEDACWLSEGATECVLVRPLPTEDAGAPWLKPGDRMVFEVIDPGEPAVHRAWATREPGVRWPVVVDGDAGFREPLSSRVATVVTLTEVEAFTDPLAPAGQLLSLVRWTEPLPCRYPVGIDTGSGEPEVTVARGNVVPAHHGRLVGGGGVLASRPHGVPGEYSLQAAGLRGDPGVALRGDGTPYRMRVVVRLPSGSTVDARWVPTLLMLTSPTELGFVLDFEEHEPPLLRFRTGDVGLVPPGAQSADAVVAKYEIGGGTIGNVPANALAVLEHDTADPNDVRAAPSWQVVEGITARNPVAATGGRDADPLDVARRDAPEAFAVAARRAVTTVDYASTASGAPGVAGASAERSWSGSWPVVRAVVDLDERADSPALLAGLGELLEDVRMLGTEAVVTVGTPVGLFISLVVCARPGVDPEALRRDVLAVLRPGTADSPGVFHPSRLELGRPVYLSTVLAAVAGVSGVDAVQASEARRLGASRGTVDQVITVGPSELPVLDDDPDRPERGRLDILVRGGSGAGR